MTKYAFVTYISTILDNLLSAGITPCNVHQARELLDYVFDSFEDSEFEENELELQEKEDESTDNETNKESTRLQIALDKIADNEKDLPKELRQYFHTIDNLTDDRYVVFLDESEGDFISESFISEVLFNGLV
jgi:hypothetical protein